MSKRARLITGLVVAVAIVVAVILLSRPAGRFAYGVMPIGPDEAVLLTRRNDNTSRSWVQLSKADGTLVWSSETTPFETEESLGHTGVAANAQHVYLIGDSDAGRFVRSLARATGELEWETRVADGDQSFIGRHLLVDDERIYAFHDRVAGDQSADAITALALDGRILWSSARSQSYAAVRAPGRLMAVMAGTIVELDGATGATLRSLDTGRIGCDSPLGLVALARDTVILVPRDGSVDRTLKLRARVDSSACGARADDIIVTIIEPDTHALVRIDSRTGAEVWHVALPGMWLEPVVSASGDLPRFLPLVAIGAPNQAKVIVVDLDKGTIVSQAPRQSSATPIVSRTRAYVMSDFRHTLTALDPATGARATASDLFRLETQDIVAEDLAYGQAWFIGHDWAAPSVGPRLCGGGPEQRHLRDPRRRGHRGCT